MLARARAPARATPTSVASRHAPRSAVGRPAAIRRPSTRVPSRAYHERVIDHYEKPRNVGSLNKADPNVGTGVVGAPECGDVMKLQIRLDPVTGKVVETAFKTFGCGSAIASSSFASEWAKGKTLEECLEVKNSDIAKYLSLPPVKLHCSMLAEDALKAAVQDLQEKAKANFAAKSAQA